MALFIVRMKNLGRLALAMTLDKALQHFLDSKYDNFLVFEDDVMIHPELPSLQVKHMFSDMLSVPSTEWQMQYLGFCFECTEDVRTSGAVTYTSVNSGTGTDSAYIEAIFPLCTHALLLSRTAVLVLMNTYKPFVSNKGDWMLHVTACEYDLKARVVTDGSV